MKKFLLILAFGISSANACPQLDGVDLASGKESDAHKELGYYSINLSKEEFVQVPGYDGFSYEMCKDSLVVMEVVAKETGRVFNAVLTSADHCDGGNSYGALYGEDLSEPLGEIGDSFISCF